MTLLRCLPGLAVLFMLVLGGVAGAADGPDHDKIGIPERFKPLLALHSKLAKPEPGDWLDQHQEPGQTYVQYVRGKPVRPDRRRRTIFIQPLGEFDPTERKILDATAEYLGIYFQLPVKVQKGMSLDVIPAKARRKHPSWGMPQILSTYVLDDLLPPQLPKSACVELALTTSDLWPGKGWNFVFGQASLRDRVGVWSIYRNGDPHQGEAAFRLCLRRTLKTASHETGHMFSMQHCTLFECNMCGSNHLAEADRQPLWLCPVCLAKLCYATGADPIKRYRELAAFAKAHGLKEEQAFYEKSLEALTGKR